MLQSAEDLQLKRILRVAQGPSSMAVSNRNRHHCRASHPHPGQAILQLSTVNQAKAQYIMYYFHLMGTIICQHSFLL
jgi:hypothetical protein